LVILEEEILVVAQPEVQPMSEDDMMKQLYVQELEAANIQDELLLSNLKQMMEMGYYNYKVNYNLLVRNNKDLIVAINNLCNHIVSDSMF